MRPTACSGSPAVAETLPHRREYLLMGNDLMRRILAAYLDWLDEVEPRLSGRRPRGATASGAAARRGRGAPG